MLHFSGPQMLVYRGLFSRQAEAEAQELLLLLLLPEHGAGLWGRYLDRAQVSTPLLHTLLLLVGVLPADPLRPATLRALSALAGPLQAEAPQLAEALRRLSGQAGALEATLDLLAAPLGDALFVPAPPGELPRTTEWAFTLLFALVQYGTRAARGSALALLLRLLRLPGAAVLKQVQRLEWVDSLVNDS